MNTNEPSNQRIIILGMFTLVAVIFLFRIFYLQIVEDRYRLSANDNVLRRVIDYPSRGLIYDTKGKLLVYNEAVYDLLVIPRQVKNIDIREFCSLIGITKD